MQTISNRLDVVKAARETTEQDFNKYSSERSEANGELLRQEERLASKTTERTSKRQETRMLTLPLDDEAALDSDD